MYAAVSVESLGTFGDWQASSFKDDGGGLVCFMQSAPVKQSGAEGKNRGKEVFFFITHWQGDKSKNVVSVAAGYPYKKGSRPVVTIDSEKFKLAPADAGKTSAEREMAWAENQETDNAIATAIQKGSTLVVEGVSQRGTQTKDTYSLKGSAEAYKAITGKCAF